MQNSQQAYDELRAFQSSRRKAGDILAEQQTRVGIPAAQQRQQGLRTAITNTENLIRAVEPSVNGRTGGSLVSEAQRSRLVGLERQPLDESFREQSRAYENESANLSGLQEQAKLAAQLAVADDDAREKGLSGIYSTLYQREQDAIAKAERDRAFEESRRQAAAQSAGLAGLFGGGGASAPATTGFGKPTNSVDQDAYNEVRTRISGDEASIRSDYAATLESARRGNMRDKAKIQFYHALKPGLFGTNTPASGVLSNTVSF